MRHAMAIFTLCLLAVSAYAGTYMDNFDDGDFDGWEIMNYGGGASEWKVEDGMVVYKRTSPATSALAFGEPEWRNYTIECDARIMETLGGLYSIGFELRASTDYSDTVWFLPSKDGWAACIWLWLNNQDAGLSDLKSFNLKLNNWYRFKAIADEDNFEFYIDGELMASLSDSRFPTGRIHLAASGSVGNFDNVVITGDDVPDSPNIAAISASDKLITTWGQLRSR